MSSEPASVLVIGAQGVLGRMCAETLRGAGLEVIRAGRRPESSPDFRLIDLDDPRSVADGCAGVDLVLSTVRHSAHAAERLILREGGTLLSAASLWAAERADLKAHADGARGLVILDAGGVPGVSSLFLKEMLAEHPDADGLESAGTFSALEPSGRGTAIDATYPILRSARRHPTRVFEFPAPIGRRRCLVLAGPDADAMIFGGLLPGHTSRIYICNIERPINAEFLALNALGLLSRMPVGFFTLGSSWKLRRNAAKLQSHVVAVTRGEERLAAGVIEGSGNYLMTAAAIVGYAEALLRRRASGPSLSGVLGVEDVFDLSELRNGFESRGIRIVSLA